ncbi:MAG: caspase family protein, partial [Planctomycetes bacterium]|nr:caspase family protein [Planctomycetota bacterium]
MGLASKLPFLLSSMLASTCAVARAPRAREGPPPAPETERGAPAKLALLVGLDHYAPDTPPVFAPLAGCVADVRRVKDLLVQRFGFDPKDVLVLEDEHASHAGIVRAFHDHLIARATAETEVVFWFSGHGSRVPDASGASAAELDHKDSTLLAYDSRAGGADGAWDFCDDELRSLLYALTRKTARVTLVTDACHSGGAMRGAASGWPRARSADEGRRPLDRERLAKSGWPADVALLDDGDPRAAEPERYVHVSACGAKELAQELELPRDDGVKEHGGALTLFLLQALDAAEPNASYRAIADQAAVRLSTHFPAQHPWYEGALSRELFGARFAPRPPGFLARATPSGVRIDAGVMHGLETGAKHTVAAASGAVLGRVEVVAAAAAEASARWCEPAPANVPDGALRAVEESRPAGQPPLPIVLAPADTDAARARAKALAAELAQDERVAVGDAVAQH